MGNLCIGDAEPQHRKLRVAEVPWGRAKGETNCGEFFGGTAEKRMLML